MLILVINMLLIAAVMLVVLDSSNSIDIPELDQWFAWAAAGVQQWTLSLTLTLAYFVAVLILGFIFEGWSRQKLGASDLAKKSPSRLREVAASYQVKLTGKAGNTWDRIFFFGLYVYVIAFGLFWLTSWLPLFAGLRWVMVFGGTLMLVVLTAKAFFVSVPKHAFLITTNFFTGYMHVFMTGLGVRFPWDRYNAVEIDDEETDPNDQSDLLSMRSGEIKRSTRTTTKDGIAVTLSNWVVQWGVFLPLAPLNIRYSTSNISDMVEDPAESFLNQQVFETQVEDLRTYAKIDEIEHGLLRRIKSADPNDVDTFGNTLEERGGLIFEMATLGPMKFDEDYEQVISLDTNIGIMQTRAKKMAEELGIDGGAAMDNVYIAAKENVRRTIHKVEFDPSTRDTIEKAGPAVGTAMAAAAAVAGGGHGHGHDEHHGGEHHDSPSHDDHHEKGDH